MALLRTATCDQCHRTLDMDPPPFNQPELRMGDGWIGVFDDAALQKFDFCTWTCLAQYVADHADDIEQVGTPRMTPKGNAT